MYYDFHQLTDKELEHLVNDLLSCKLNKSIERFKAGMDGGIDGRFYINKEEEVIIQTKHYLKSGISSLLSKLKSTEAPKVKKLLPNRYIFATSVPLSPSDKAKIMEIFSPFIHCTEDILGQGDLNDLLSNYSEIEKKHYKLWIQSTNIYDLLLNNAIHGRSEFELEEIQNKQTLLVRTKDFESALRHVQEKSILIICGEPGIGKTTLALNLSLYLCTEQGYRFFSIEESITEAENVFKPEEKQIFYFDDFLGTNYLEAIANKKDSHIVRFIARVRKEKYKILILTSRTNIFELGIRVSDSLKNAHLGNDELLMVVKNLMDVDKAKIFYNHIWHSDLSESYIEEIYKNKRYRDVVRHRNFNPRLIEHVTDVRRLESIPSDKYWDYIYETLDNPHCLWEHCFEVQSDPQVRNLVLATVFNGGSISEESLRGAYDYLCRTEKLSLLSSQERTFSSSIKVALRSFLNKEVRGSKSDTVDSRLTRYSLFNPSIADYIFGAFGNDITRLTNVFSALDTVSSLKVLKSHQKFISHKQAITLYRNLFNDAFERDKSISYRIAISRALMEEKQYADKIVSFLKETIVNIEDIIPSLQEWENFLDLLFFYQEMLSLQDFTFISNILDRGDVGIEQFEIVSELIRYWEVRDEKVIDSFSSTLETYLINCLENEFNDLELGKEITFIDEEYGVDYSEEAIRDQLNRIVLNIIEGSYLLSQFPYLDRIDIKRIVDTVDIGNLVNQYLRSDFDMQEEDRYIEDCRFYLHEQNIGIDDLFEKD